MYSDFPPIMEDAPVKCFVDLMPDHLWDDDFAVELAQEVSLADTGEGDECRGVAHNLHRRPSVLRVARSSS